MATPKTCAYRHEPAGFKCGLPVWDGHDTLCILHDPSLDAHTKAVRERRVARRQAQARWGRLPRFDLPAGARALLAPLKRSGPADCSLRLWLHRELVQEKVTK